MTEILHVKTSPVFVLLYAIFISSLAVFFSNPLYLASICLVCIISLIVSGGFKINKFLKIKGIIYLVLIISIVQSFFNPSGNIILQIGRFSLLTTGGVMLGISVMLRMIIILSSGMIIATKKSSEIIKAMRKLKIPYELAVMATLAIRFIPMLSQEMKDSINAISLKGVRLDKIPLGKKIRVYTYLLMPVISQTIVKAREISMAMDNRGFRR